MGTNRVDDAEPVLLAGLEDSLPLRARPLVGVRAVDQAVLHSGRSSDLSRVPQSEGLSVAPVVEEEDTKVLVIVGSGGSVQHHSSVQAFRILQTEVAVVPGRAILRDLELVGHRVARHDGALGDARDAVLLCAVQLPQSMPVNRRSVVGKVVCDVDLEPISISRSAAVERLCSPGEDRY